MTPTRARHAPAPIRAAWRILVGLAAAAVGVIATIELLLLVVRPEDGLLAVVDILTPHLALLGLALAPVWLTRRTRTAGFVVGILVLTTAARFGGNWWSLPATSAAGEGGRIEVATWNLEVLSRSGESSATWLRGTTADVIALQELQPDAAAAIAADEVLRTRFPYRTLLPRSDVLGLGLLSRVPIISTSSGDGPAVQTVRLQLRPGRTITVINAHPMHSAIATAGGLPIGFDEADRNADLDDIRAMIESAGIDGTPVILLGDLNTADTEPAFERLVDGFRDVHADVGQGPGWTWRPIRFEFLGIGLVRIDHIIVSPLIEPLAVGETCPPVGDHCLVHAELAGVDVSAP